MVTLFVMAFWGTPAAAGAGCHSEPTQGRGKTVKMVNQCFTPSVLRTEAGADVTFVSRDAVTHNVSANGWGQFDDMSRGDSFTATFDRAGVYPFACMYHPGMTGAIVVGNGTGAGKFVTVDSEQPDERTGPVAVARPRAGSGLGWLGFGAAGFALGAGLALLVRRSLGRDGLRS
jgi:plastocyanin